MQGMGTDQDNNRKLYKEIKMDTIKVYLDNMFKALPDNQKVRDAKAELFSMMEDKYHLLKEEGKTENEAVGIVINEFGNLDEIAETLGISHEVGDKVNIPEIAHDEVVKAVETHKLVAPKIASGVLLIMVGVSLLLISVSLYSFEWIPITEDASSILGGSLLIIFVALAVYHFIYYGSKLEPYEKYEKELVEVSYEDRKYLEQVKQSLNFEKTLARSVILFIISPVPILLTSLIFDETDRYIILSVALTTLIVAIGVFCIIRIGIVDGICNKLLQIGDYTQHKKTTLKKYNHIFSAYWLIVTAGYIAYSIITKNWGISWVVWPIAGILFGVINILLNKE